MNIKMCGWIGGLALCLLAFGCGEEDASPSEDGQGGASYSREDARRNAGKADGGFDICDLAGWYGDGICDPFCVLPDEDCQEEEGDICEANGWYDDNLCDSFCPEPDPDCSNPNVKADEDEPCGGVAGIQCQEGLYCNLDNCGVGDATGLCAVQPEACTREFAPVCGCNGETYSNACHAAAAGATVASPGACGEGGDEPSPGEEGEFCGGRAGGQCAEGLFCRLNQCNVADQGGECAVQPEVCTQQYDPVCGCDGRTYSNACHAASVGASVGSYGACGE